jgi:hypothetical protein
LSKLQVANFTVFTSTLRFVSFTSCGVELVKLFLVKVVSGSVAAKSSVTSLEVQGPAGQAHRLVAPHRLRILIITVFIPTWASTSIQ